MTRHRCNLRPVHQLITTARENQTKEEILSLARSYYGTLSGATHRYDIVIHKRPNETLRPGAHYRFQVTLIQHHGGVTMKDPRRGGQRVSIIQCQLYRRGPQSTRLRALESMREELLERLDAEMDAETGNEVRTFMQKIPGDGFLGGREQPLR
ncbi:hypothetical protein K490DRAFT_68662 [Saccharata proteae CBS 121410]|uniref:Uncharacterized protein n=1 Tax=Saccharata proteae CBS 121410 TaxID=1314787 RepID=A0A9P4HPZ2_9PEZI|nr:hypothetical protein K490DRAFT_68662 [Saccharata proteae CBS 121410]